MLPGKMVVDKKTGPQLLATLTSPSTCATSSKEADHNQVICCCSYSLLIASFYPIVFLPLSAQSSLLCNSNNNKKRFTSFTYTVLRTAERERCLRESGKLKSQLFHEDKQLLLTNWERRREEENGEKERNSFCF